MGGSLVLQSTSPKYFDLSRRPARTRGEFLGECDFASIIVERLKRLAPYLIVIAAALASSDGVDAAGFINIQPIGLPMGIQSVAVDAQGFLWTAGAHGVCRFDGTDWLCPEERAARTLHIDSGNSVWSGLADGTAIVLHPPGRLVQVVGQVGGKCSRGVLPRMT